MKSRYIPQRVRNLSPSARSAHRARNHSESRLGHVPAGAGVYCRHRVWHLSPGRDLFPSSAHDEHALQERRHGHAWRTAALRSGRTPLGAPERDRVIRLVQAAEEIPGRDVDARWNLSAGPARRFESLPLNQIFEIIYSGDAESRPGLCRRVESRKKTIDPNCASVYIQVCHPQGHGVIFRRLRARHLVFRIILSEGSSVDARVRIGSHRNGKAKRPVPRTAVEALEEAKAPFRFVRR
jgi:hypothetical protein